MNNTSFTCVYDNWEMWRDSISTFLDVKMLAGTWEITWHHTQEKIKENMGEKFFAEISENGDVYSAEDKTRRMMQLIPCTDENFPYKGGLILNFRFIYDPP